MCISHVICIVVLLRHQGFSGMRPLLLGSPLVRRIVGVGRYCEYVGAVSELVRWLLRELASLGR